MYTKWFLSILIQDRVNCLGILLGRLSVTIAYQRTRGGHIQGIVVESGKFRYAIRSRTVCGHWQTPTELPQVNVWWQSRENAEWLVKHRQTGFTGILGRLFGVNMVNGVVLNCLEWYSKILDIQAFVQTNKTYYRFYCKLGGSEQTWVDCDIKHDPKWANMHKIFPIYRLDTMLVFLDQQQLPSSL